MANSFFQFKQFTIQQDACAMKVCTDACLFGAWCAAEIKKEVVENKYLLDIGTGTGLLSLMVRQESDLRIDAVEIENAAAAQAQANVHAGPWPDSITIMNSDVLHMGFSKRYDYIISNPPFYQNELQSPDHKRNAAHHSSHLTLQALLSFIAERLQRHGTFFLLLPYKRSNEAKRLLRENGLMLYNEISVRQTEQHAPFRILLKGGFGKQELETSIITITASPQQYTPAFTNLLKPYYLYL